jgi:hypothetical protein
MMFDEGEQARIGTSREAADAWHRLADRRVALFRSVSERMLDLAGIEAGSRVLDVPAGTGDATLPGRWPSIESGPTDLMLIPRDMPHGCVLTTTERFTTLSWTRPALPRCTSAQHP